MWGQDSNLSPSRQRANALGVTPQPRVCVISDSLALDFILLSFHLHCMRFPYEPNRNITTMGLEPRRVSDPRMGMERK